MIDLCVYLFFIDPNPLLRNEEVLFGESTPKHCSVMPKNLHYALEELKRDKTLIESVGEDIMQGFFSVKEADMAENDKEFTQLERDLIDVY